MVQVEIMRVNNKDYVIMKEVVENDISFVFLSNLEDPNDMMIRKSTPKDPNHYVPLDNEEEYQLASLLLFQSL